MTDVDKLLEILIDYKYIKLGKMKGNKMHCSIAIFIFEKDKNLIGLDTFEVFKEHKLPTNSHVANLFQKKSPNQFTHLHVAVMTHSITTIKRLLSDGHCDLNAKDAFGRTALDMVGMSGVFQEDILDIFIESGKALDFQNVFFHAIQEKNIDLVRKLLAKSVVNIDDLNKKTFETAITVAIEGKDEQIIKTLMMNDAAIKSSNLRFILLHYEEYSPLLVSALDINVKCEVTEDTLLHVVSFGYDDNIFADLLLRGANPNIGNKNGDTPLDLMSITGAEKKYRRTCMLVPYLDKAELNKALLIYAKIIPIDKEVEQIFFTALLEKCKDDKSILNARDAQDTPLLIHALMKLNVSAFERLLKLGCDPNIQLTSSQNTILIALLKNTNYPEDERIKLVGLLLDAKDINLKLVNKSGESALSLVEKIDNEKIKALFVERGIQMENAPKSSL